MKTIEQRISRLEESVGITESKMSEPEMLKQYIEYYKFSGEYPVVSHFMTVMGLKYESDVDYYVDKYNLKLRPTKIKEPPGASYLNGRRSISNRW